MAHCDPGSQTNQTRDVPPLPRTDAPPRTLVTETALVLGVSLGASAIYAVLAMIKLLTARVALNQQTSALNQAVTRTGRGSTWPTSSPASGSASCPRSWPCTC